MSTKYENIKSSNINMNRFYGGIERGVCLLIHKANTWKNEYKDLTLSDAIELQNKFYSLDDDIKEFRFFLAEDFYLTFKECLILADDLDLFIEDDIHC